MVNIEHKDVLELLDAGTCTALMERPMVVLPEPDSPTRPKVSPRKI